MSLFAPTDRLRQPLILPRLDAAVLTSDPAEISIAREQRQPVHETERLGIQGERGLVRYKLLTKVWAKETGEDSAALTELARSLVAAIRRLTAQSAL